MPQMTCSHPDCSNVLSIPPDSFVNGFYWCALHTTREQQEYEPKPITVKCAAPGCNNTYEDPHPLKGTTYFCHRHVIPQPMPLTKQPDSKFVPEMNAAELREHITELEEYHETDLPTLNHSPDEKIIVTLTDKQIAEIHEAFRKQHNDPELGLRPMPPPTSLKDYHKKVDRIKELEVAFDLVGMWLSAALDDPKVCDAMKADIRQAFEVRG